MTNNETQPSPATIAAPSTVAQGVALASASTNAEPETQNPKPETPSAPSTNGGASVPASHATETPAHRNTEALVPAPGSPLPASADSLVVRGPSSSGPSPLPGESPRAFEAFCAYLELGPSRRYTAVARKVGVGLRTIKRWAAQFDWRTRVSQHVARAAELSAEIRGAEVLETATREKSLRERQLFLAETIVDVTERYFEQIEDMDFEHVRLPDVCRALEFASRLLTQAQAAENAKPDTGLRDQLASLLDQAFREMPKPTTP